MITILCNFWQFLSKNWRFSQIFALFWVKNANIFAEFFGENIFKIITSVPDLNNRYVNFTTWAPGQEDSAAQDVRSREGQRGADHFQESIL
jgi:hypothetical protein